MDKAALSKRPAAREHDRPPTRQAARADHGRGSDTSGAFSTADILASVKRREMFVRYIADAGLDTDQLATRLMLAPARIEALISGRAPISNELATHIEEMLQLPASWLDQGGPLIIGELPMPHPVEDTTAATADALAPMQTSDRKQVMENRRLNLIMLTSERGSKHRLAQLAGTSGSRISLMTSARKPVSDPFAHAIEDGLGFARGWLDQLHREQDVPVPVWQRLRTEGSASPAPGAPAPAARATPRASRKAATPPGTGSAHNEPGSAPELNHSATGLFDKTRGRCGPIAEALAKTILNLSAADKLSEARAFQLLGELVAEAERHN